MTLEFLRVPIKGDIIKNGYLTHAFSGAHMRTEVLRNPCILGGPPSKGTRMAHFGSSVEKPLSDHEPPPPPRSHFENPFLITKVSREVPRRCPRGGSGVFEKPPLCCFTLNPGTPPPLVFIPRTPQIVLGPLYLDGGGGSPGGPFGGGGVPVPVSRLHHI